jgi:hypothetical protein
VEAESKLPEYIKLTDGGLNLYDALILQMKEMGNDKIVEFLFNLKQQK